MPSKDVAIDWASVWNSVQNDTRDIRDPGEMGERLIRLRDSDELKKKYCLSQVYDFFFDV